MARVQVAVAIGLVLVSTYVTYARATAGDASMRDPPYVVPAAAGSVRYLDSNAGIQWTFHGVAEDGGSNAADAIPTKPTPATVPGDLLSDLHNAGFMPPPLHGTTWLLNRTVWDGATWYWTASFATASPEPGEGVLLVLDGVKMGAHVYLNGIQLDSGGVTDQFLRVSFPISQHLAPVGKNNTLVVEVPPPGRGDIPTNGRFMASTGGWDWAPHSNLTDKAGALTFTRGIWKSVSLVRVTAGAAAIAEVGVDVGYLGSYPAAPLSDADHDAFNITLSVSLYCPTPIAGTLAIGGNWTSKSNAMTVSLPAGTSTHTIWLNDDTESARLWWPVRMGEQPLYSVTTSFTPAASENDAAAVHASRAIGFRVFNLVTANSSIPGELQGVDGSGNFTMRWRINGADVFARGGNMIPMEELDALVDAEALTRLVQSAADGGMNTLRLWGGGIWQYEPWYEAADAAGMLIYHDAMYAQAGHSPTADATQKAEIEYQVRRLSHHPSIVVWDACNECRSKGSDVYASFVSTTIARTNPSNVVWPSCPSNGWTSGVDRLTGLPNGKPLIAAGAQVSAGYRAVGADGGSCGAFQENTDYDHGLISPHPAAADAGACCALCAAEPSCDVGVLYQGECWLKPHNVTPHVPSFRSGAVACWPSGKGPVPPTPSPGPEPAGYHEFHGPYTAGSGHASVVSSPVLTLFNPNTPPVLPPQYDVGPFERGHFRSEFGASVMSSFESISTFLDASDWGLHSAPMFQHNWVCDSTILSVFGKDIDLSGIGEEAFKKQLYLCTLAQALYIASSIEAYRGTNSFGIVIWQLNEIWPTGGWGSLEYGTPSSGQVIGGRWKPLHNWLGRHLFADTITSCGADGRCYVRYDGIAPLNGTVQLELVEYDAGRTTLLRFVSISFPGGVGQMSWFCIQEDATDPNHCAPLETMLSSYGCATDGSGCGLSVFVADESGATLSSSFRPLGVPSALKPPKASLTTQVAPSGDTVHVLSNATALFVTLTTLAQGRFDDNSFLVLPGPAVEVKFHWFGDVDVKLLQSSLRVEHLAMYM